MISSNSEFQTIDPFKALEEALQKPKKPLSRLLTLETGQDTVKKSCKERAITYLNKLETRLDEKMPNLGIQNRADQIGSYLQSKFAPLEKFNTWLNSNGQGTWYAQLATFLAKLPARAVRNIINLLYGIIKTAIYSAIHPLKSLNHLAKLLISLVDALTKPETWSKMGVGMMGASLGQAVSSGNPLSVIGLGIGGAMTIGGLTAGALKSAMNEEKGNKAEAAKQNLLSQAKELPETALTGFCIGLIIGGIQRAMQKDYIVSDYEEAKRYADQFIRDHDLTPYTAVELDSSGGIRIIWERQFFHEGPRGIEVSVSQAHLILRPNLPPVIETYGMKMGDPYLPGIDFKWTYPTGPESTVLCGPIAGTAAVFNSYHKCD